MTAFEERKRALAAESELFRQTLRWEWRNLRLRAAFNRQKYPRVPLPSWLMVSMPLAGWWLRRRPEGAGVARFARTALVALQLYKKLAPFAGLWLLRRGIRKRWLHSYTAEDPLVAT